MRCLLVLPSKQPRVRFRWAPQFRSCELRFALCLLGVALASARRTRSPVCRRDVARIMCPAACEVENVVGLFCTLVPTEMAASLMVAERLRFE